MPQKKTAKKSTKTTRAPARKKASKKVLIAYYSRTDTTMRVSHDLALHLGADIIRIRDHRFRAGPIGWLLAGRDGMKGAETEISYRDFNMDDYGTLILGTPVWASSMTPAIRSFIKELPVNKKVKVCTFATHMGGLGKTLKQMADALKKKTYAVAKSIDFKTTGKNKQQIHDEIARFAAQLKK